MKKIEPPSYEQLYQWMCVDLLPQQEIADKFHCNKALVNRWCIMYGIKRTKEQIDIVKCKTNIKKFGVPYASQHEKFKEKSKKTCLEKYGVENVNKLQSTRDKIKKTNLGRYGVEHPSQNKEIQDKIKQNYLEKYGVESINSLDWKKEKYKQTCLEKYGCESALQNEEVKQRIKETNLKNLGVEYPMQSKEVLEKSKQSFLEHYGTTNISNAHIQKDTVFLLDDKKEFEKFLKNNPNKSIRDIANMLNVTYDTILKRLNNYDLRHLVLNFTTQAELDIQRLLLEHGIKTEKTRQIIPPYELDLYSPEYKIAIEYNGDYWHSEKFRDKEYHEMKTKLCEQKGIKLIHIWEHDWMDLNSRQDIINHLFTEFNIQ